MKLKKAFVTILILLCAVTVTAASAEESVMIMGDDALAALAQELYACYPKDISGTIEFYQQKPEVEEWYDEAIRLFMKLYPNIIVEQNVQNNASGYLRTRAVYGAFTDVWLYWPTDAVFASFQKRRLIMDVSDEPFVQYSVADIQDLYAFDGKMYGVPIAMNCAGIVCNPDLYEACGLHLPSTWEELMNACSVFRENGIDPCIAIPETPARFSEDAWTETSLLSGLPATVKMECMQQSLIQGKKAGGLLFFPKNLNFMDKLTRQPNYGAEKRLSFGTAYRLKCRRMA